MTTARLVKLVQLGLLILVALMPVHALMVHALGTLFGHESIFAAWKEVWLLILAVLTGFIIWKQPERRTRLNQPAVSILLGFVILALIVTTVTGPAQSVALFGLKTDLEFLLAALIALIAADRHFGLRLGLTLLFSTIIVVVFALLQATILPKELLSHIGYGFAPGQTAPYETVLVGNHLAYRFGSTLGGPNQLGTFLILPLLLSLLWGRANHRWWLLSAAILPALFISYSRGAWLGAVAALVAAALVLTRGTQRRTLAILTAGAVLSLGLLAAFGPSGNLLSNYLHHPAASPSAQNSDSQHLSSLQSGLTAVISAPLGHGLGTAGPATFHAGEINIIEDNYLQIGYETGLLGLGLFLAFIVLVLIRLLRQHDYFSLSAAGAIIGISVTALVLPAWTDSSTALTVWTLAGAALGARRV